MNRWILAPLATLALTACGSPDEGKIPTEDGDIDYTVTGDGEAGQVTLSGPDGDMTVDSGTNVDPDLPEGVVAYPGATISNVTNVAVGGGNGAMVSMETPDSAQKVVDWYKAEARKRSFAIEAEVHQGDLHMLGGKAADGREFSLTASDKGGNTTVQLIAGVGLPN
ncbi:hypothetical protein [Croceicoccus naphthovorans]|uniref:hypothetical protein n=1 Tax=Croceicoccus naphthovorans TaxID=1348774 RepID=UPI00069EECFB|nr:hypothetical protein [Croceicoccus naphthovorans]MBB3990447.1 hypothetical protein [Croceicoccus naphthovorans]